MNINPGRVILYVVLAIVLMFMILTYGNFAPEKKLKVGEYKDEPYYEWDGNDDGFINASKKAKATIGQFDEALNDTINDYYGFAIKVLYVVPGHNEYFWVENIIKLDSATYWGTVMHEPKYVIMLSQGDSIRIKRDSIIDWEYFHDDKAIGSYTSKAIRKMMSEEDRRKYDADNDSMFVD